MHSIARVGLASELFDHAERHGAVTVGVAGAGQMGLDLPVQLRLMPGVRLGAVSTSRPAETEAALGYAGYAPEESARAETGSAVDAAIVPAASTSWWTRRAARASARRWR